MNTNVIYWVEQIKALKGVPVEDLYDSVQTILADIKESDGFQVMIEVKKAIRNGECDEIFS